ncbi:hypothetical protein HY632_00440 [Candidatus Uhrbacteria bacterium]|nr:hypothetical protein [Candidatus Uhrbacteria bacterium]
MLQNPQGYLDGVTNRLRKVVRWRHYGDRRVQDEDVCTHENQALHLAMALYDLELAHGDATDLDEARLYRCAGTHDDGEGIGGDVRWDIKNHPVIGPLLEAAEREHFVREVIAPLPEAVRQRFLDSYALQDDRTSRTGRFFNAIEVVGYIIRAYDEWMSGGSKALALDVFTNSWDTLERYRVEFVSVRILVEVAHPEMARALETPEGARILREKREKRAAYAAGNMEHAMHILDELPEHIATAVHQKLDARKRANGTHGVEVVPGVPVVVSAAP